MSLMGLGERIRIVAITATVTSAAWLLLGGGLMQRVSDGFGTMRKSAPAGAAATATATIAPMTTAAPAPRSSAPVTPQTVNARGWIIPVSGVRADQLVDTFTASRSGGRVHDAIDIVAPLGTPVVAAVAGKVEKLFTSKLGGLTVYVRSPDRTLITYYAHLDRYAPGLAENQQVRQGQVIGYVGSTGSASPEAPHLHFEIMPLSADRNWWQTDKPLNPYPVLGGKRA